MKKFKIKIEDIQKPAQQKYQLIQSPPKLFKFPVQKNIFKKFAGFIYTMKTDIVHSLVLF